MNVITLFAANAVILVVMAGAFFAASRTQPDESWWSSWIAANLVLATGLTIFAVLPVNAGQISFVPHTLLVLGFGFRWRASQLFVHGRSSWVPALAPAGMTVLLFTLPAAFSPGAVYAAVNVILAAQTAGIAWQFWRGRGNALPSSYGLVLSYSVIALSFAIRTVHGAALMGQFATYLPHDRMLELHLVVALLHTTASGAFALSLAYERVVQRHRRAALRDGLTHLANRTLFDERLRQAMARAITTDTKVGLLLLDIDHFKQVNDTFGHDAGDELLRTFADRLRQAVRTNDTVARLGGDEFAVIFPDIRVPRDLSVLAGALVSRMREPVEYAGKMLDCRASVGACLFPLHGATPEELQKNADIALYTAKSQGRGNSVMFEAAMRSRVQTRATMIDEIRIAIEKDLVFPHYQPVAGIRNDGKIAGFEALLRWSHAAEAVRNPAEIRSSFVDMELASAIADRMLDRVIGDTRQWLDGGIGFGYVAVNAAAADFRRDDFAERFLERLTTAGLPTGSFHLEVKESAILDLDEEHVHRTLGLLSKNGVKIALDDFGEESASLNRLKHFPIDIIKLSSNIVGGVDWNPADKAIIRAVVTVSESMGIDVVAKGVETPVQHTQLRHLGCGFGQGVLYAKPVPASDVPGLLQRQSPLWKSE